MLQKSVCIESSDVFLGMYWLSVSAWLHQQLHPSPWQGLWHNKLGWCWCFLECSPYPPGCTVQSPKGNILSTSTTLYCLTLISWPLQQQIEDVICSGPETLLAIKTFQYLQTAQEHVRILKGEENASWWAKQQIARFLVCDNSPFLMPSLGTGSEFQAENW